MTQDKLQVSRSGASREATISFPEHWEPEEKLDVYFQELMDDPVLLKNIDTTAADVNQGHLVLEALCINALWTFGITFERVCKQYMVQIFMAIVFLHVQCRSPLVNEA